MEQLQQRNRKVIIRLSLAVCLMFAFGFALVPLYDVFCQAWGINGKTAGQSSYAANTQIDRSRTIRLEFIAQNNEDMPWLFKPGQSHVKVHPGQLELITYSAYNPTNRVMQAQAIPSVSPGIAASHLHKITCFCFQSQTLKSKEGIEMPVKFYFDADLPKEIQTVTLSYTLFDISPEVL